jgi:crotonobetainyl-CoA:carnitine CoA-transferase CaiB-like acyl-CoA transferase
MLIQALTGMLFLAGRAGDPPTAAGIGLADQYTALHIVIGTLAALAHREQSGQGQRVELDLFSCTISAQQQELTYFLNHGSTPPRPAENHGSIWATAPFGIYPTADSAIAIAMTPCPVIGRAVSMPELARYDTNALMLEHRAEIYKVLAGRLKTDTTAHWIEVLLAHDVWCAPVQTYEDLVTDPQALHNEMFWDVPVGQASEHFRTPGSPFKFSETPVSIRLGVPDLGQHTYEILSHATEQHNGG